MHTILSALLIVYGCLAAIAALFYIPKYIQFGHTFRPCRRRHASQKRKISLVVPARNESHVIEDLFSSIEKQTYDREYFDVTVIVAQSDDLTVKMAESRGYRWVVVPDQTCKGEALDGYFHSLTQEQTEGYAAFVIIDADAVLTPDYVEELNNALEYDCHIFTTRKNIKNYLGDRSARSVFCNCSALNYPVVDDCGNNYRRLKGVPSNLCGQGLMVRKEVIQRVGGWPYRTLTEDNELRLDSYLQGFTSMYYPYAVLYTEEVVRHRDEYARRLRWVTGYTQCDRKYKKEIRNKMKREGASFFARYDCFFSLVPVIFFIVVTLLTSLAGIALTIACALLGDPLWSFALLPALLPLAIMYLLELSYCALAMRAYRDVFAPLSFREKLGTLLFAPLFMFEYFPLYVHAQILMLFHREAGWKPTRRVSYRKQPERRRRSQYDKIRQYFRLRVAVAKNIRKNRKETRNRTRL